MADIEMPQLGETVTEGTITQWFKAVGDHVDEDEVLFEVSTDKVDSEVPSPVGGYLAEILVEEGDTVDVGTRLAVVSDSEPGGGGAAAGEDDAADATTTDTPADAGATPAGGDATADDATPEPAPEPTSAGQESEAPDASGQEPTTAESSGATGAPGGGSRDGASGDGGEPMLLSPVVRRLVEENQVDVSQITGSGPGGRITRSDVQKVIESGDRPQPQQQAPAARSEPARRPPAPPARPAPVPGGPSAAPAAGEHDEAEPLNNIRRRTAEHMVRSKEVSAHVYSVVEVDFEAVDRVRSAHKEQFKVDEGFGLTYLPFVSRALVDAVAEFPHLNASVGDGELIVHQDVNLGVAVDLTGQGLIVPVIHRAQDMRLRAIARQVSGLADRARNKQLSADDITGGTVTISNNGGAGTFATTAIINQPQVMVLSTEGVSRKPVVVTDAAGAEALAIHSVGNLTLGWDHRAFDGAYAGAFLARIRNILETRDWEAEL